MSPLEFYLGQYEAELERSSRLFLATGILFGASAFLIGVRRAFFSTWVIAESGAPATALIVCLGASFAALLVSLVEQALALCFRTYEMLAPPSAYRRVEAEAIRSPVRPNGRILKSCGVGPAQRPPPPKN